MMVFLAYEGAWQKTTQFVWGQLYVFICKQKQNDEKIQNFKSFHGKKCVLAISEPDFSYEIDLTCV